MTDKKASEESAAADVADADLWAGVKGGFDVKFTFAQVKTWIQSWVYAGPTFTGAPAAPTATPGTNTAQIATTGFVKAAIDVVLGGVSSAFDTLAELATAVALKANTASPTFTGTVNNSGGQIKFPATQSPSSDVNTLDDYEEALTWTPTITFGGNAVGVTYAAGNSATSIKIGKFVFVSGSLRLSSKGSSTGNAQIAGVSVPSDGSKAGGNVAFYSGFSGLTGALILGLNVATNDAVSLSQSGATASALLTDASFTNSTRIDFSFAYLANG